MSARTCRCPQSNTLLSDPRVGVTYAPAFCLVRTKFQKNDPQPARPWIDFRGRFAFRPSLSYRLLLNLRPRILQGERAIEHQLLRRRIPVETEISHALELVRRTHLRLAQRRLQLRIRHHL